MSGGELARRIREAGLRATMPRVRILGYLQEYARHPSAQDIYHALKKANPSLSLATVYTVLEAMVACGLVRRLAVDPQETRYDGWCAPHQHFFCERCRQVSNLSDTKTDYCAIIKTAAPHNCTVTGITVCLQGECARCGHHTEGGKCIA